MMVVGLMVVGLEYLSPYLGKYSTVRQLSTRGRVEESSVERVHCHLVPGRHGRLGKAWTPSGQG